MIVLKKSLRKLPNTFYVFSKNNKFYIAKKILFFYITIFGRECFTSYESASNYYKAKYQIQLDNIPKFISKEQI